MPHRGHAASNETTVVTRSLDVWWEHDLVGTLKLTRHGSMSFAYSAEWLTHSRFSALSMSLPKREQRFSERECRPFFSGLLPEDQQLEAVAAALALSKKNDFALLSALGGDVAGALTLWPSGEVPPSASMHGDPTQLDEPALADLLDILPKRPLLAGSANFRLSLAGAQPKLPVVLVGDKVALPGKGQPTTHILKPPIARFEATTENEALVMRLAATAGLDVAPAEARLADGRRPYLLVTRYDRRLDGTGRVSRLHQEDFCQALGIVPEHKYEAEGGPTFATSFDLVRRASTRPAFEVLKLLDAAIFNVIVGNSDAHGKNFSLLYVDNEVGLAPLYDLLCTVSYPELSPRLAMKIGRRATLEDMGVKTWPAFAETTGLGATYVLRRVREIGLSVESSVSNLADQIAPGFQLDALKRFAALIETRASRLLRSSS